MSLYEKALSIATKAHMGQERMNGDAYITHPIRVADRFEEETHKTIAVLHDTIEDTDITKERLLIEDIPKDIVKAVVKLSKIRKKKETYFAFIMRICEPNDKDCEFKEWELMAIRVKLADLEDNLRDLNEGSMKDKYRFAHKILKWTLESNEIHDNSGFYTEAKYD